MGFSWKKTLGFIGGIVGGVIGFVVAGPVGLVIGAGLGYATGGAVADVLNFVFNPGFDVPDADVNQNIGVTVNKQGTNNSIPVVYGERLVGGTRVAVGSNGESNQYLYVAFVVSEGEINAFKKIYIDDVLAWEGTSQHGARYNSTLGKFSGYFTFETFHGRDDQAASPLALEHPGWTSNHRLRGLAYLVMRFKWYKIEKTEDQDKTPWKGGIPNVTCVIQGRKVAVASTFANTIDRTTAYENETLTYSDNPVDCLLDYMRNPRYGKGLTNDKIDFLSFKTEWSRINTLDDGSSAPDTLRQKCNAVVFTDRNILQNVKTFLFNMRAAMPYTQGRFKISLNDNRDDASRYGPAATAVMSFNHDDIIGTVNINAETDQSKYNRVIITYMGGRKADGTPTNESVEYTWPEPGSQAESQYLAEDNYRINEQRVVYEHITQDSIAKKLAEVLLAKSRYRSKIISFTANARAQALEINDIISVYYQGLGIDGKFRVQNISLNPNYTFNIVAEEHNDLIYAGNPAFFSRRINGYEEDAKTPKYYDCSINEETGAKIIDIGKPVSFRGFWSRILGTIQDSIQNLGFVLVGGGLIDTEEKAVEYTLAKIAVGDICRSAPQPILPPDPVIDPPVLTRITASYNTATTRSLTFDVNAVSNGLIKAVEIWYQAFGEGNFIKLSYNIVNDITNGRITMYGVPVSAEGYYAVKYVGDTVSSALSNRIYFKQTDLQGETPKTPETGGPPEEGGPVASPVPTGPLPTPHFTQVSFAGSGSGATATFYYDTITDSRVKEVEVWGSRWGDGVWLRINAQPYSDTGNITLGWNGFNSTDWLLALYFDTTAGVGTTAGLTRSNQIYVLTTDQVDGESVGEEFNEPYKAPEVPLETPVFTSITITGPNDGGAVLNFTPPTDPRVTDVLAYWISYSGYPEPIELATKNLAAGTITIKSSRGAGYPMNEFSRSTYGFYYLRFRMKDWQAANANGTDSANSNQIYVEEYDWDSLPATVTRNYKPSARPLPIPTLNSVNILTFEGQGTGTNTLEFNITPNADSRLYQARAQYKPNNTGNTWLPLDYLNNQTTRGSEVFTTGSLKTQSLTQDPASSNGAMVRLQYYYGSTISASVQNYSNEIWLSRTQLANPPVLAVTESKADPFDPLAVSGFIIKDITVKRSDYKFSNGSYATKLIIRLNIPVIEGVYTGSDIKMAYVWPGYTVWQTFTQTCDLTTQTITADYINPDSVTRGQAYITAKVAGYWYKGWTKPTSTHETATLQLTPAQLKNYGLVITP